MLGGRNSRFDITTVTQGQGLPYAESFQQQQAYAQRVLRQGHRCPSGGELTQYYQMQGAMHGAAGQQPNGADGLHGIYGRGDYTEPVGGYATWHPNGSNLPKRALTDLFPTLASSGIQSQSADRVHGSFSLHLNDLVSAATHNCLYDISACYVCFRLTCRCLMLTDMCKYSFKDHSFTIV